jgi:hypothetical protein
MGKMKELTIPDETGCIEYLIQEQSQSIEKTEG